MISDLFSESKEQPLFINKDNMKKIFSNSHFTLYPIHRLAELVAIIQAKSQKKLRFVVDRSGHAWFAEEGSPNRTTPAHYQMLDSNERHTQCITAGSIRFSDDYQTIAKIKNKSGDFHPSVDSLKWFLAILLGNPVGNSWLPQTVLVIKLENDRPTASYGLDKMELHTWLSTTLGAEFNTVQHQPEQCKVIVYSGPMSPPPMRMSFLATSPASSSTSAPTPTASSSQNRLRFLGHTVSAPSLPPFKAAHSSRQLMLLDEEAEVNSDTMEHTSLPTQNSGNTHDAVM